MLCKIWPDTLEKIFCRASKYFFQSIGFSSVFEEKQARDLVK